MSDSDYPIQQIKERVLAFAKGATGSSFIRLKTSQWRSRWAAELMEHFLWQSPEQSRVDMQDPQLRAKVEEELADIFIFAIQFANVAKIDLSAAIQAKMKCNAEKYPVEKAKGRSDKYTDLRWLAYRSESYSGF